MYMRFSYKEKKDLAKAWFFLSAAFAILFTRNQEASLITMFFVVGITVGLGFLLHEIAHKYYAIKYGYSAEFVADDKWLFLAVLMAFFLPFVFAAPGAVWIRGNVTQRENGIISVAGPITNIVLAFIFLPLLFFPSSLVQLIGLFGAGVNGFLALFNMFPFGNLDGKKVLQWNKPIYFIVLLISAAITFTILF